MLQLVKTTKPTGEAQVPPHVEQAYQIEELINEHAGTHDLDDDDLADTSSHAHGTSSDDDSSDSDDGTTGPSNTVATCITTSRTPAPVARAIKVKPPFVPISTGRRTRATPGSDLLEHISSSFDPANQARQEDERTSHAMQTIQLLTLSNQLRDMQATIKSLRMQLTESEHQQSTAECCADRAEHQAELALMVCQITGESQ